MSLVASNTDKDYLEFQELEFEPEFDFPDIEPPEGYIEETVKEKKGMFGKILGSLGGILKKGKTSINKPEPIETQKDNSLAIAIGALALVIVMIVLISKYSK